jgi:hypothetical protein
MAPPPLPSPETLTPPPAGGVIPPEVAPNALDPEHDLAALFRLSNLSDLLETYLERPQL